MEKKRGQFHLHVLSQVGKDLPVKEFKPLKSHWTVAGHDRDQDRKKFSEYPSQYRKT